MKVFVAGRRSGKSFLSVAFLIREAMAGNNYIEALNLSEEASQKYPEQNSFVQLVGENQLKLGRVEEAKRSFQRAIKLDPKEVKPHVSLADLYFEQGKFVYAALSYSDAVYLDPDNSDHRYMQGLSYFNAQEWGRTASSCAQTAPASSGNACPVCL